jgi:hypothetical protein
LGLTLSCELQTPNNNHPHNYNLWVQEFAFNQHWNEVYLFLIFTRSCADGSRYGGASKPLDGEQNISMFSFHKEFPFNFVSMEKNCKDGIFFLAISFFFI